MNTLNHIVKKFDINLQTVRDDRYVVIPGKKRIDLIKMLSDVNCKMGAEIGVMRGQFSEEICKNNPTMLLWMIDSWKKYEAGLGIPLLRSLEHKAKDNSGENRALGFPDHIFCKHAQLL